ncbi:TetR/AcrR family transcriptional regulator [Pseudomonas corrugata]|uniref:TetR/AcrR family transcriptional regulator n=1 Tax=Pseudomonas corrugata TaxID=47879 RepID=UPI0015865677|nr:TetR/AcrR family transcriptional regulator [Pseudomonas corrugata]MCI0995180.1 TetR/AcrR family transcriptional regulator [Pseudomonas corrugata]NUT64667.1 TetR/AcrR family transcriptional regulator [Pseudomonas corrugata]
MKDVKPVESAVRARTRLAILESARKILPVKPSASIIEIAEAAGVGRSTIHRYFSERSELIVELAKHVYRLSDQAIERAKPDTGAPAAALRRIIEEQFELAPALDFIYNERTHREYPELFTEFAPGEAKLGDTIRRASRDDMTLSFEWRAKVFWSLLRLGAEIVGEGQARHEAIDAIMETLTKGLVKPD